MAMSPRGMGAICSLLVVGVLVKIDARLLIGLGFLILAYSCCLETSTWKSPPAT